MYYIVDIKTWPLDSRLLSAPIYIQEISNDNWIVNYI